MFGMFKIILFWDMMLCSQLSLNISEETAVSTCKVKKAVAISDTFICRGNHNVDFNVTGPALII
jgi:hypothetical protein